MDAEEIAKLVEGLRVSADARERVVMITNEEAVRGRERIEKVVVGKIFSKKVVNRDTLRQNLPKVLKARASTEIEIVGQNLFVISFALESDKRVALEEGPWHFFQDLMILKQTEAMQTPMEVSFDKITLWVQCHNIPLECMEPGIVSRIGGRVGEVEEVDVGEGGLCVGRFARVRVTRRIDEPLVRCVPLVHEVIQKEVIVVLQYEKLPEFCFACGRVGHISRDCWDDKVDKREFLFDSWLRAGRPFVGRRPAEPTRGGFSRGRQDRGMNLGGGGEARGGGAPPKGLSLLVHGRRESCEREEEEGARGEGVSQVEGGGIEGAEGEEGQRELVLVVREEEMQDVREE